MVIADTSVWLDYINRPESPSGRTLDSYLTDDDIQMVGPVLTEILQGCVSQSDYDFWSSRLAEVSFIDTDKDTWLIASEVNYRLMRRGNMLGFADLIITSLALQHSLPLLTLDSDFERVDGLEVHLIER
ncbi:MAG: PIN domain-containing protein [Dehalococcoidia bacterium]|nr:PIN domain-containing protein [Dehalococcoidia bacterium]